jgi:IS6 family transposase
VILLAVRWYLRYGLAYRVRSRFHERGIEVDHVTLFRWVHAVGDRWFVDQTT